MQGLKDFKTTQREPVTFEPTWRYISAEDRERARIGALMHDEFGQCLAVISFALDRWSTADTVDTQECIAVIRESLAQLDHAWRHALLSPNLPRVGDMLTALERLCAAAEHEMQLHCALKVAVNAAPPAPTGALVLLRGVSELLLNVYKHAGSPDVEVRLDAREPWVEISVRDRGATARVPDADRQCPRGYGLMNLKHELRIVGGDMRIDVLQPGREVRLRVPSLTGGRTAEAAP